MPLMHEGVGQGSYLLFTTRGKYNNVTITKERFEIWASVCTGDKPACPWSGLFPAIYICILFFFLVLIIWRAGGGELKYGLRGVGVKRG